jgi:hypothetical protein
MENVPIGDEFRGGDCSVFGEGFERQNAGVIELLGGIPPRARATPGSSGSTCENDIL